MPSLEVTRGTESQQRHIVSEAAGRAAKYSKVHLDETVPAGTQRRKDNEVPSIPRDDIFRRRYDVTSTSFACWG